MEGINSRKVIFKFCNKLNARIGFLKKEHRTVMQPKSLFEEFKNSYLWKLD